MLSFFVLFAFSCFNFFYYFWKFRPIIALITVLIAYKNASKSLSLIRDCPKVLKNLMVCFSFFFRFLTYWRNNNAINFLKNASMHLVEFDTRKPWSLSSIFCLFACLFFLSFKFFAILNINNSVNYLRPQSLKRIE